jgi:predicted HTH transcriptional regulator
MPALNSSPSAVFLNVVENCDIYLGLFGELYGYEDSDGVSPTEREFDAATANNKVRLVYIKQSDKREHKEELLIEKAESVIVRKGFNTPDELRTAVYASLVYYLLENEYIRTTPFDATLHPEAAITDLNEDKIRDFADEAYGRKRFPFDKNTDIIKILTHLDLIKGEKVSNAALLLFSDRPQRYFITSEVRCAHFHGLRATKPIPSYQVYRGSIFEMIASAVDFVLSKINVYSGDRSKSINVEVQYELPVEAVTEAIVNAVAHRDYTSNASVQVMLFPDRLEVLNPGRLPVGLSIEDLYNAHKSIPANPLIADVLYYRGTIDRMGTGTGDIVEHCTQMGLKQPTFKQGSGFEVILYRNTYESQPTDHATMEVTMEVTMEPTMEVTMQVKKLLKVLKNDMSLTEIQESLNLKNNDYVRLNYVKPALTHKLITPLYPDSPNHPQQKYRITEKGRNLLEEWS